MPITRKTRIKIRRVIALFMLFTILNQIFAPSVAFALTAGPTAPEATNFEPIDTTDMVNPLTGSFTYGMPLLEVPGPEGSYPLSLSYHANVQPNEEASWVGLGWTLNPGAIARNVNGYPDDWNSGSGSGGSTFNYWNGGQTTTYSVGVGIGLGNAASVNVGLSFSQDTYHGFGAGFDIGLNFMGASAGLSSDKGAYANYGWSNGVLGANIGVSSQGGAYAGAGIGYTAGVGVLALSSKLQVQTNFNTTTAGFSEGISVGGFSLMDASISTGNMKPSFSVGGGSVSSVNNSNAGKISSQSESAGLSIPIGVVSISLGYSYRRYWSATTASFNANGVINNNSNLSGVNWTNNDDDNYSIADPINAPNNNDPLTTPGGTFPNFDDYSVTAQGLGGSIRPYIFSSILFNQSRVNNNDHSHDVYDEQFGYAGNSSIGGKWQFRFINDLSNSYRQQHPWVSDQIFGFDANPQYGNNAGSQPDGTYGYDPFTNRLEGTNHIEYFTNLQISNGTAAARGFITCPDEAGFLRTNCPPTQIGGFMITNSSGVTYHYALPAYSKNESFHSEVINTQPSGFSSTDLNKNTPYAYTWYLTAITGPDYVSRGATPGLIDPSDWGYWVKFEYGQWANSYNWNTPSQGLTPDIDGQFQTLSRGSKEIYYLDAIQTRTHTAIFEKELRADAKGAVGPPGGATQSYIPVTYAPCGQGADAVSFHPTATLRLKEILLLQNDQLNISINTLRASTTNYNISFIYNACLGPVSENLHQGQNVIDSWDIAANPAIVNNCLRRIVFNHDYSLCPGVPNSYDPTGASTYIASPVIPTTFLGKLTLLSVDFQGKGGTPMTPPIQFKYDLDPASPVNKGNITITNAPVNQTGIVKGASYAINGNPPAVQAGPTYPVGVNQQGTITAQTPGIFNIGDILSFQFNGLTYYCTILSSIPNVTNGFNVLFLNNSPGTTSQNQTVAAVKTKNPPYNYDAYDSWQCYKSDYVANAANLNLARFTTSISALSTDAWSLRKIVSSVGANININYESNTFNRSVLNKLPSVVLNAGTSGTNQLNADGTIDFTATIPPLFNLSQLFLNGNTVSGPLMFNLQGSSTAPDGSPISYNSNVSIDLDSYPQTTIVSITGNIKVQLDPNLYAFLKANQPDPSGGTIPISSVSLVAGNLIPNKPNTINYGGGIRIKNLTVDDLNGSVKQTVYNYGALGHLTDQTTTSGVTAYLPTVDQTNNVTDNSYLSILSKHTKYLTAVSRQVPGPGVLYETVAVNDFSILPNGTQVPIEGTTVYQYEVFKSEMVGLQQYYYDSPHNISPQTSTSGSGYTIINQAGHDVSIKDFTSRVGNLKRLVTYDNQGNILTEKINHYLYDDLDNTSFQNQVNNYEPRLATFTGVSAYNGVSYNDMGVILERYATARASIDPAHVTNTPLNSQYDEMLAMSNVETFPAIQTGTTQIDYKNGTSMSQSNLAYDFYTGAVTQTQTTDSYGNRFISVATPAYMTGAPTGGVASGAYTNSLVYPALGLKTHDDDAGATQHKQMLSQQASNYNFSVDANNNRIGVVTATVQTWSNSVPVLDQNGNAVTDNTESNIWRMEKSFSWMPSGSATNNVQPYSTFADYYGTANGGSGNAAWKKTAQITQYNVYSAALEATDINNNYATTRMGYGNSKVLITGGPARYNEIAYSGAEDALLSNGNFSNNILPGSGVMVTDSTKSHTGFNSLMVSARANGFTYIVPITSLNPTAQNYSVSVWVKPPAGGSVNNATLYYQAGSGAAVTPPQTYAKSAAGCYLLEMTVPSSAINGTGNLVVGCTNGSAGTLYFDDFRFQPIAAATTAYVYDSQTGELTYILGNNNLYTRFQYDAIGRLVRTYKEVLGKTNIPLTKAVSYNYGSFNRSTGNNNNTPAPYIYYNFSTSQVFSSQNCGTGTAPPITYTVPAWTYSSNVSQQAANTLAQNDISANGQTYANLHGPCMVSFTLSNSTGIDGFTAAFSGIPTPFPFPPSGSTIIQVPIGSYSVYIGPVGSYAHTFMYGFETQSSVHYATFSDVTAATSGGNATTLSIQ